MMHSSSSGSQRFAASF